MDSPFDAVQAERALDVERYEVSQAMMLKGGTFVRHLGHALANADPDNTRRIKAAFPEYWSKYLESYRNIHHAMEHQENYPKDA